MLRLVPLIPFLFSMSSLVDGCISGLPDRFNLTSMSEEIGANTNYSVAYATQYIFTALEFNCSGAVTGWTTLALDGAARGRPEISIWTPSDTSEYTKRAGLLMDSCSSDEEVAEGTGVYLHQTTARELLYFQPGDVLGMLMRLQRSADFSPLLVDEDHTTGFSYSRSGPYENGTSLFEGPTTDRSLLLSLELCVDNAAADQGTTYPNCSTFILPSDPCPMEPTATSSSTAITASLSLSPSLSPSSTPSPSTSSSSLPTWGLIVAITVPCVLVVLLVVVTVLGVYCVRCMKSDNVYKVDFPPNEMESSSTLRMMPYNTLPQSSDSATHTYETPMDRLRPSVTISLDHTDSNESVIINHTRSGSHAEASVYEEPLVSVSQYEGILGAQHQQMYDSLMSPESSQPPVFSRYNSPHLLPILPPPSSSTVAPYYHTLERPLTPSSPSPPQNRAEWPNKGTSPLVTRASRPDSGDGMIEQQGLPIYSNASQDSNQLPPGYQIITTNTNLKLNSGVYVPTYQQRSQFSHEPIFDDIIYADLRNAPNSPLAHNWSFFEETEHYWKPSSDKVELYHQLHIKKFREVNRKQIQITEHMGSGESGMVCKGFWHTNSGSLEVAIKMVQKQATEEEKVRLLQEAAILGQFRHPNIVQLHGVVTVTDPVMVLLELMKKGDLKAYLHSLRPVPGELELQHKLLKFCNEVAQGLQYLGMKNFVHRDIAARNILLTEDCICKIADFGISRDLDDQDYFISNGGVIPFNWTSPEALHCREYTSASDVWSYGVLLWEIWSLGQIPYTDCQTVEEATAVINSGARLRPPPGCPRAVYKLMMECWNPKPSRRPTFTDILKTLNEPSARILHWNKESQKDTQAHCLGASLEAGHALYPDLQTIYSKMSV